MSIPLQKFLIADTLVVARAVRLRAKGGDSRADTSGIPVLVQSQAATPVPDGLAQGRGQAL